jgi:hypothetical protein
MFDKKPTLENGRIDIEERTFVTSLSWDSLSPKAILRVVRNHWAIENDVFNSLDLWWREDDVPWCSQRASSMGFGALTIDGLGPRSILSQVPPPTKIQRRKATCSIALATII